MGWCEFLTVAFQLAAAASVSITLIHESCPAGFDIVEGIIPEQYACRCSSLDRNILSCNTSSEDILLKVRLIVIFNFPCAWNMTIHPSVQQKYDTVPVLCTPYCLSIFLGLSSNQSVGSTSLSLTSYHLNPPVPSNLPSSHAGLVVGHSHHQLRGYQGPGHHRLFPWLLPLPAVVHRW